MAFAEHDSELVPAFGATGESWHTAQSGLSKVSRSTTASIQDSPALSSLVAELGIDPWEVDEFAWIAEVGLETNPPPRYVSRLDADSGATYFVDLDTQTSTWENPLVPYLKSVVEVGRMHLRNPVEGLFEEQKKVIWSEHKAELDCWHGPIQDEEGNSYFVNSRDGISSWQDPRTGSQYLYDLQCLLLEHLQGILCAEDRDKNGCFGGGTPWETEDGSEALSLEGVPVSKQNPGRKVTRIKAAMQLEVDHTATLEEMRTQAEGFRDAAHTEEEVQRLKLIRKVEERRMRKLNRKLSKAIHETPVQDEDEVIRTQLESRLEEQIAARARGKL